MQSSAVVEGLDVVEDNGASFDEGSEATTIDELDLRLFEKDSMKALSQQLALLMEAMSRC